MCGKCKIKQDKCWEEFHWQNLNQYCKSTSINSHHRTCIRGEIWMAHDEDTQGWKENICNPFTTYKTHTALLQKINKTKLIWKLLIFPFYKHLYLTTTLKGKKKHAAAQQSKTAHATARHAVAQLKVQQRQRADLPSTGCEGRKTQRKERKNDINTNAEPDAPTEYNRKN